MARGHAVLSSWTPELGRAPGQLGDGQTACLSSAARPNQGGLCRPLRGRFCHIGALGRLLCIRCGWAWLLPTEWPAACQQPHRETRLLAGTGLAAGSPHLPFPGPPVHHTGSDVHYGCPGHPSSPLGGGLPLEVPVSWGRGRSPLLLPRSTGNVGGTRVCPGAWSSGRSVLLSRPPAPAVS